MDSHTISLITIPIFSGAIGYVTNWSGVWMLFYPVRFAGFRLAGLAALAGARYLDRVPAYLNNLYRLGLIWFSREPLEDPLRYQVLEAQPDVIEAMRDAGRGKTVRRSIHLTPFGEDFCRVCLPASA